MTYSVHANSFEDAVAELVRQFRQQNPGITNVKLEYEQATVSVVIPKKPKKRHPMQSGPSVTTTGGFLP